MSSPSCSGKHPPGVAPVALQSIGRALIAAGGAAQAEIDPAGKHPRQHAEGLRHLEGAVMGQHDSAAADLEPLRRRGHGADQRLGAGAGQHRGGVMLGQPITVIAEAVRQPGEIDAVAQRLSTRRPFGNRRLVEDAEAPEGADARR